jgi:hypothetical protein
VVIYFFLGIALLIGLLLIARWYVQAPPAQVAGMAKLIAFLLILAAIVALVALGRLSWAMFVLPALLPWLMRIRSMKRMWKAAKGPARGQSSNVSTETLAMELDHDSGEMDGSVLAGPFEGRRLSDLDAVLLADLYRWMAKADMQGARLLEAYLDRTLGSEWRAASGAGDAQSEQPADSQAAMSREEAYDVLGLSPDADDEAVRRAYRRLMQHVHPDKGGSPYLAAKINAAKALLLEES